MRRRDILGVIGGAVAVPLVARAQQSSIPAIGFVHSLIPIANAGPLVSAFRHGLKETGFVEGQDLTVEYRSAEGSADRLRVLVADLLRRPVDVMAGNALGMLAAKAATKTVPIVFAGGTDAVKIGLVDSLNRPGGNVTGASFFSGALGAKRLELLRQLVPDAKVIAMLVNPDTLETEAERRDVLAAAATFGQQLAVFDVTTVRDIETAFATVADRGAGALFVGSGPFLNSHRRLVIALAARHKLPASYGLQEDVKLGGLMSYGTSITDAYRQAGLYVGRILKGEKPSDLPVIQSTSFELNINLRTARALGLEIPDKLLALANEVIE